MLLKPAIEATEPPKKAALQSLAQPQLDGLLNLVLLNLVLLNLVLLNLVLLNLVLASARFL